MWEMHEERGSNLDKINFKVTEDVRELKKDVDQSLMVIGGNIEVCREDNQIWTHKIENEVIYEYVDHRREMLGKCD